jgi:Uma2 family endonuclease
MENEVKEPAPKYGFVSQEDYLAMERVSEEKHEYYRGEVSAMAGASLNHNMIFRSTYGRLYKHLEGKSCQPFGSDLRIHIPSNTLYTYPYISIVCGEAETTDLYTDNVTNPSVIIEILSKSTKDYDRGSKFMLYRSIKTLKEYITIDSLSVSAEVCVRQSDNTWLLSEFKQLADKFVISTINMTLLLNDVYEGISFQE